MLAAQGDIRAKRWLRNQAVLTLHPRRRMAALFALSATGDTTGLRALGKIARSGFRWSSRIHAATALGRLQSDPGWRPLRELASSPRPRLRLRAAARLANETDEVGPILDMILDNGAPDRYRIRAVEILRRNDRRPRKLTDPAREQYPWLGSAVPRQRAAQLAALAGFSTTPPRLRIALADAGLPRDEALALLASIAHNRQSALWHRIRAADSLQYRHYPNADQILRELVGDDTIPRVFRWFILYDNDEDGWEEFGEHIKRYRQINEGPQWLRLPRLASLFLGRLNPTKVATSDD